MPSPRPTRSTWTTWLGPRYILAVPSDSRTGVPQDNAMPLDTNMFQRCKNGTDSITMPSLEGLEHRTPPGGEKVRQHLFVCPSRF